MNLRQLSHFVALAETGRFVAAAERVHLSQAAFSRSIQSLESAVGLRLFDRNPSGAQLTPAGKVVLERARQLLFDQRCFSRDLELLREGLAGELSFGAGPVPAAALVPDMLIALRQQQPGVKLRVRSGNALSLLELLHAEEVDFFLADPRMLPADERLEIRFLGAIQGGLYCRSAHPLARKRDLSMETLMTHSIAAVSTAAPLREVLRQSFGLKPEQTLPVQTECDDFIALARLASKTDTLVLLPHSLAAEAKGLKRLHLKRKPLGLQVELHAIWLRGRTLPPAAHRALELAAQLTQALPADPD